MIRWPVTAPTQVDSLVSNSNQLPCVRMRSMKQGEVGMVAFRCSGLPATEGSWLPAVTAYCRVKVEPN